MEITALSQLDLNQSYTHLEYISWRFQERVELIMGKIFPMSAAPSTRHQQCSQALSFAFSKFFHGSGCGIFHAPFDVFFLGKEGIADTVLQPDLVVVCDRSKLKSKGCFGTPDLVVEIISPFSVARDLHEKYFIYDTFGVKEYWIVQPDSQTVTVHILNEHGRYQALKTKTFTDRLESSIFPGLEIDLDDLFENLVSEDEVEYAGVLRRI